MTEAIGGLAGLSFVSFKKEGEEFTLHQQGRVIAKVTESNYLVMLHDWVTGEETFMVILPLHKMTGWRYFRNSDQMNDWIHKLKNK